MNNYIIFKNGEIIKNNTNTNVLWWGEFSKAFTSGSIVQFVVNYLKQLDKNTLFLLTCCDGDITLDEINNNTKDYLSPEDTLIVSTLAQVSEDKDIHYLYFPLDDEFFENGVSHYFQNIPSWNEREAIAYWRGGCSGLNGMKSVRCRVVGELLDYDKADAKITRWGGWENGKGVPDNYLSNRVHYSEMLKYKIFMIIDGNYIASNHMWGFASGGVPFIISNAKCWFIEYLTPFVNYIPIQYDLSDLKEKIDWVINNDSEAEQIAKNALQFSRDFFSSEFQKKYLIEKINQMVGI